MEVALLLWERQMQVGWSTAMGLETTAIGEASNAMGKGTTASGDYSTAMGYQVKQDGLLFFLWSNNNSNFSTAVRIFPINAIDIVVCYGRN